jgi:hypothetical protein
MELTIRQDLELTRYWEKKSLKLFQKYRSPIEYTNHIRYMVYFYNEQYNRENPKISKYEAEAERVMKLYIKECQKIKRHDQVTFGHRYLSVRKKLQNQHQAAIHHLTDAIKYCRKHHLGAKEIQKSINGLFPIINSVVEKSDVTEAEKQILRDWKVGYSLKGLTQKDIETIDDIITNHYLM